MNFLEKFKDKIRIVNKKGLKFTLFEENKNTTLELKLR